MKVEIRLFSIFRDGREKRYSLDLEEGSTPENIINMFKIDEKEIAILLINGRDGKLDTTLMNNDVLSLFPPVGGG